MNTFSSNIQQCSNVPINEMVTRLTFFEQDDIIGVEFESNFLLELIRSNLYLNFFGLYSNLFSGLSFKKLIGTSR